MYTPDHHPFIVLPQTVRRMSVCAVALQFPYMGLRGTKHTIIQHDEILKANSMKG